MAIKKVIILEGDGSKARISNTDVIAPENLGTGTRDGTRFLRDDNTWQTVSGGGGLTSISGTLAINFGNEENIKIVTIADALITNANVKTISFIPQETAETSLDDFTLNSVRFNIENIIDNVSFDIRAVSDNNASGNYTIKYLINI